jgi:hypothetical protein
LYIGCNKVAVSDKKVDALTFGDVLIDVNSVGFLLILVGEKSLDLQVD